MLMHRQSHFDRVKSSSSSSIDACGYVTLCYAIGNTGSDGDYTNVYTPPQFYLWKSATLKCIHIPHLYLVNWRCYIFYTAL